MLVLRIQCVLFVLVVAACVAGVAAIDSARRADAVWSRRLRGSQETVARLVSAGVAEPLSRKDDAGVATRLRQAAAGKEGLCVAVLDLQGTVLVQEPTQEQGGAPGSDGRTGSAVGRLAGLLADVTGADASGAGPAALSRVVAPSGETIGFVRVDAAPVEGSGAHPAVRTLLILFGAASLVAVLGAGRITRPLARIHSAMAVMLDNAFDVRVPVAGARGLRGMCRGINTLAARGASMHSSKNFINNVVQSMVDTLIVVDQQAKIKAVNQATLDLLGYSESELVGRTASLVCLADNRHLTAEHLEQLLGRGSKNDHEVTYFAKDGRSFPISLSGSAIRDSAGNTTGYVCIGTDITQRKDAEREREDLNRKLMATSRQAGMAEVATGVLHNVGNVLNSVNVSASLVEQSIKRSRVSTVAQVAGLMTEHAGDLGEFLTKDERGRMLPQYMEQLARHLGAEQEQLLAEVRSLTSHIGHIKDIISVQQSIAKTKGVIESVSLRDLLEDALRMSAGRLDRHRVKVVRQYASVPPVKTDKHMVLQILVNIINNSMDAMKEARSQDKSGESVLTLRLAADEHDPANVCVEIRDSGIGIARENLTRIFTHGFTTKQKGHGFGLHSAALAAKELQGSLTAHSDGPGTGAGFVLSLPIEQTEPRDAGVTPT